MRKILFLATVATAAFIFGCNSMGPKVIEKSGSRDKWVSSESIYFEEKEMINFRGEVSGVYDLALGKRQAEADAKKRLVEAVASELTSEYREFARGSNTLPGDVGRFIEDGCVFR